jgi:ABC-type nitrate/sulfonate/bicarbonate transport system substrate-binding protein
MSPRSKGIGTALCAGALALTLAACGSGGDDASGGGSANVPTVSIAVSSLNASHLWEIVARDKNIFAKYGVNLKLNLFQGASQVVPSMLGGSSDIAEASTPQAVAAMDKQPGLLMAFGSLMGSPLSVVTKKGITSPDQLRGKKISVNAAGGSSDYYSAVAYLNAHGVNPKDVTFVTGGATSARVTAMLSGQVDAVLCGPPDLEKLTAAGDNVLGNVDDIPNQKNALAYVGLVQGSWAKSHRDALVRFIEGFQATQMYMRDPANKATVEQLIQQALNTDAKAAADVYGYFVEKAESNLDPTGQVTSHGISLALAGAGVPAKSDGAIHALYDNSYLLQAAKVSGAKPLSSGN